ncbi:hypothetical protein F4781DRAFT_382907 [Annulohypoxylon bovei var. microspora]|nr:hypothetical protein F4781DRAFT_382907 [Annulohypoxylon bovei var. microspora]
MTSCSSVCCWFATWLMSWSFGYLQNIIDRSPVGWKCRRENSTTMGAGIRDPTGSRMQETLSEPQVSIRNVILAVA